MELHGAYDERFAPVKDAFLRNFEEELEVGAAAAVTVDGDPVLDIWAGVAGPGEKAWEADTIVNVYSTTKTMAAICMLVLADRGQLDFNAPVASYWPEFAQNGKESVLVRHVMSHSAGVSGFDPPISVTDLYDTAAIAKHLEKQAPWWQPGTASGYHAITQGQLQGEILRRITGKSLGTFFREEIAGPLGADFHIGLDAPHDGRVGELIPPEQNVTQDAVAPDPDSVAMKTMMSCSLTALEPRTREWRAAQIPAAGGIGNARSIARVHSALACGGAVDGVSIMSEAGARRVLEQQTDGMDLVIAQPVKFAMGFALGAGMDPSAPERPGACFWGGWGGSLAIVDLDARVSIAYVMNRMEGSITGDPRGGRIVNAVYKALGLA